MQENKATLFNLCHTEQVLCGGGGDGGDDVADGGGGGDVGDDVADDGGGGDVGDDVADGGDVGDDGGGDDGDGGTLKNTEIQGELKRIENNPTFPQCFHLFFSHFIL